MNIRAIIQREEKKKKEEVGMTEEVILLVTKIHQIDAVQTDN